MIQDEKFYYPEDCLPFLNISKSRLYELIRYEALPPLERPYQGIGIKGYWGRTLRSALATLTDIRKLRAGHYES